MGPNIIFASLSNRVRLGGCIKLHYGRAVFFFFWDVVSSLTRAFSLHKIHIYWNKRKGHIRKIAVAHSPRSRLVEPRSRCQPTILHKLTATV